MFDDFPLAVNLAIFAVLAGTVWLSGTHLSYFIDAIAERTRLARAFLGIVLLATATELPEMVTTLTAAAHGEPSLALNNMFGGMMLQLAVLGIADFFVRQGSLTSWPATTHPAVAALMSVISLSVLLIFYMLGDFALVAHLGAGSALAGTFYVVAMYMLHRLEARKSWSPVDEPDQRSSGDRGNRFDLWSLKSLVTGTVAAAATIFVSGVLLVRLAETLADQTGLGTSFVGVSFLSLTTSMPELSTAIAAVRVRAYTMAITNILGSNLIMTFLVLPVDLVYAEGPVIGQIDESASFALAAGIGLTSVYCAGLLMRPKLRIAGAGIISWLVMTGYLASLFAFYMLR
ncbi:MAG: hypothetical protein EOM26_05380 [Alphaproteobacteria bacterium]|nr:hypothetical protein [Alphaproteobacteria bacterium]